jgi:hypothetical protein
MSFGTDALRRGEFRRDVEEACVAALAAPQRDDLPGDWGLVTCNSGQGLAPFAAPSCAGGDPGVTELMGDLRPGAPS